MNTELLKEAVGYAGWLVSHKDPDYDPSDSFWAGDIFQAPGLGWYSFEKVPKGVIAALASQLIEQVDAMEGIDIFSEPTCAKIGESVRPGSETILFGAKRIDGPNRNENSIMACVEFMRGRG